MEIGCGPQGCLDLLAERVGPTGRVIGIERNQEAVASRCRPCASPAWTRIVELFVAYSQLHGIDPFIGRKLPRLLGAAGVADVCVKPIAHTDPAGHPRRGVLLDFAENLSARFVAQKLVEEAEARGLRRAGGRSRAQRTGFFGQRSSTWAGVVMSFPSMDFELIMRSTQRFVASGMGGGKK